MSQAIRYIRDLDRRTRLGVEDWLSAAKTWQEVHADQIHVWYTNADAAYPSESFTLLDLIIKAADRLLRALVSPRAARDNRINDLDIIFLIDQTRLGLVAITKYGKFIRSSRSDQLKQVEQPADYVLSSNMSLESVARLVVGDEDSWRETWIELAITNDLTEEEYGEDVNPVLTLPRRGATGVYTSVVSQVVNPQDIFGRDVSVDFLFEDGDLKVLSEVETLAQSAQILSSWRLGDNPNYPSLGYNLSYTNMYSDWLILLRGLAANFETDDAFTGIQLMSFDQESDAIQLVLSITTASGGVIRESLTTNREPVAQQHRLNPPKSL